MSGRYLPRVIAVVSVEIVDTFPTIALQKRQPSRDIRVDMPAEQHRLMKALHAQKIFAKHQLEIAGPVERHIGMERIHNLVEMQLAAPENRTPQ